MKQFALLGVFVIACLPQAETRKLGAATSLAASARLAPAHEGPRLPLDLDALEVSVLRLTNASNSTRSYLKPMIDSIRTMLEKELLPDIGRQYSLAQKMLDDAAKGFGSCKEPWNATQVSQVRDKHRSCRSDESNIFAQVKNTCDEAQALTEVKVKKCAKLKGVDTYPQEAPAVCDKDSSDVSYELHARRIRNFYMQKVHEWVVTEEACTNATQRATEKVNACQSGNETWRDKRSSCNAVQRTLDMSTCDAWTEYYHCSQNNSCLVEATTTYLDANTTATSMHRSMLLQWRAMKRIGCLLDALEHNKNADDLSDAITECRNKVHSVTSWALSYPYYKDWKPQLPSVGKVCEEPNFERPGKQSYKQAEYETLPTTAPADTCTADCCTRCWYFTCNSTTVPKPNQQQLTGFSQEECCAEPTNPAWKYDAWPQASCDMQCGLAAEYETRKVECWDLDSNLKLDESLCREVKPSTARTKCEETPKCGICEELDCSRGYVLKNLVPASCQGAMCTTAECCDKVCSAEDCPEGSTVRFPARICDGITCSEAVCCSATKWKTGDWSNTGKCSIECGEVEKISNRTVTCEDASGRAVEERFCAEAKPPSSKVACSATQACPEWIYSPWGNATYDCPEDCGQGQQTQERPVTCNEPDTGKVVADDLCKGPKPATARILCPATPLCVTTTSTSTSTTTTTTETTTTTTTGTTTFTTTIATCDFFLCPRGYLLKPVADRLDRCAGVCEVDECCNMASWVFKNWDETKECSPSCGLAKVEETRSVTCQVKATGKQMSRDTCQQAEPASKRLVCPATADCDGCGSIWCGADSVPLPEAPSCGSSCTRELCCRKFATGFTALNVSENAAAVQNSAQVANQGSVGGSVEFDGEPAKPSEGGRSYHLGGKTGLLLGGTKSSEFTAVIYIKLQGSDNAQEETVMLKEGGPEDFGAWELVATPLKQLRIRSFKDSETQAAIGCLCLSSYADEWAAVTVRYDGKGKKIELIVNGKVCCEAAADADPSWSDAALLNGSAPVHLGLVPGSKRPGVVGEVSTVQLWDVVLADTDLSHITAQFSQAAAWSPAKNLRCQSNIIYSNSGVVSLAACKALCTKDQNCKSVQHQSRSQICELRSEEICTREEGCSCDEASDSLASNHCPSGDIIAPATKLPDKLAHYPVTCTGTPKKPWWQQPGVTPNATSAAATITSTTTSTTTVVRASCDSFSCPAGSVAKAANRTELCKTDSCKVEECCDATSWDYISWDETKECDSSCGLKEVVETRSVTCQVLATGKQVSRANCKPTTEPDANRMLCPATAACNGCGGIQCEADEVPVPETQSCGSSCSRTTCCKKSVTGIRAVHVKRKASTVVNEGASGGSVKFDGDAAQPAGDGHSYRLDGKTGLLLGTTKSAEFTAIAYVKLIGSSDADEETVMLKEGGPDDYGAWELVATPLKQFRLRSFKDSHSQASIGCLCLSSYADEWATVVVRYDGKGKDLELVVNGKVCCIASASTEPGWSDVGLQNSEAPVHMGLVLGASRPGASAEVHAVQLWDGVLTDADLDHIGAQFSQAATWSTVQNLHCPDDIISTHTGVASLAACRALCTQEKRCRSVQYQNQTCDLRSAEACTKKEGCTCDESVSSLASTHCPSGNLIAPTTKLPDELAHYPVTCAGVPKKPWWEQPGVRATTTPAAVTSTSTSTTTTVRASCDSFTCPSGFVAKPADKTEPCKMDQCKAEECCYEASWISISWDETKECDDSCGLEEVIETRSVTCQVPATGKVVSRDACDAASEPAAKRVLCPAAADCQSCGGIQCHADEVPVADAPACGSNCTRQVCCKKSVAGIQAVRVKGDISTVTNRGSAGGVMKFDGKAASTEGGNSYRLDGKTGLSLGKTKSVEFTALAYVKLVGSGNANEETLMLKEGSWSLGVPDEHGAWELVATPGKQFRLRAFKDWKSENVIGCFCNSSYADEWASVAVRYDGKGEKLELAVNGQVCCEAAASTDPLWSDAAMRKSERPVHLGFVPGAQRDGVVADIHAVQLWDGALTDADLDHLVAQFSHEVAWSTPQELRCSSDTISAHKGIPSLATCKALCTREKRCRSVQYQKKEETCELRSKSACTKKEGCECDASADSLASTHCPDGDIVAPVSKLPSKMAHYPVTCFGAAKKPWWQKP